MQKTNSQGHMNPPWWMMLGVFLVIMTAVHLLFAGVIRPQAEWIIANEGSAGISSLTVVLKDMEQQFCVSLMLFCVYLMGHKLIILLGEGAIYSQDLLPEFPKDSPLDIANALDKLEQTELAHNPAVATWINCLRRFKNTNNVQHAADAIEASIDNMAMQLEAGNNLIRYIIWAIPSIGFVGTVRGIGQALSQADAALAGDISGMTASLGVAFNSTLVALLISLLLMLFMHLLNNRQDAMVISTQAACERFLLSHLHR